VALWGNEIEFSLKITSSFPIVPFAPKMKISEIQALNQRLDEQCLSTMGLRKEDVLALFDRSGSLFCS
jgi:hypothetical protein